MNRRHPLMLSTALACALLLASCAVTPTRAPLKLTILHTNDHHGRFWPNGDGEYGMAARKTVIDRIRAEVQAGLTRVYGTGLETRFGENPSLIGGLRITVGSDVYDSSVRAKLADLEARL